MRDDSDRQGRPGFLRRAPASTLSLSLLALLLAACGQKPTAPVADVVVLGATIETMSASQPNATALAVRDGKIAYVGDDDHARAWIGAKTRVIKLAGITVWPGLIDTHIHLMQGALEREDCSLGDAQLTLEQAAPIIRKCATQKPGNDWLVVQKLNAAGFHATRQQLDDIVRNRPLLLSSTDGHVGYVNSVALARAGIDRETADPRVGRIERDADGEPTGFLVEHAMRLVTNQLTAPSREKREEMLISTLHDLAAVGITTYLEANTDAETVRTYVDLAKEHRLYARVSMALASRGEPTDEEFARLKKLQKLAASQPQLRADLIKLFNDGVMEYPTQTAALLEPYLDSHGTPTANLGVLNYEVEPLSAFVRRADAEGFGVHIHAIGDRATRVALDAFAQARAHGSKRSYSIAHLELIDPDDIPRFHTLNVTASMQLAWAQPENYTLDSLLPYIGPDRQARIYPAQSLLASGATLAGGSDWNVSSFNPFEAMAIATSRTNLKRPELGVLGPDQKITLQDILAAYTLNAARMLGRDREIGSLEVGKAADFIVLDRHLGESSTPQEIRGTRVMYTFTNGVMQVGARPE